MQNPETMQNIEEEAMRRVYIKGIRIGIEEEKRAVAIRLLEAGVEDNFINGVTGLGQEDIADLKGILAPVI